MTKVLRLSVLLACAWAPGPMGIAQELPFYDPQAWCDRVSSSGGNASEMLRRSCLRQEQDAYDEVKTTWHALPEGGRSWCDQVARVGGVGSYMLLRGCVRQEQSAGAENEEFIFRR